jgi:predicted DNA-binding transcriptional regulator AlpA
MPQDDSLNNIGGVALLKPWQAAQELNMSKHTLANYRAQKTGPAFVRIGRAVRYRRCDLQEYVSKRVVKWN